MDKPSELAKLAAELDELVDKAASVYSALKAEKVVPRAVARVADQFFFLLPILTETLKLSLAAS